ncbi:MAG: hypothetical protein M3Z05_09445 [Gemmatimonadota bacterium]|nr:hypothetical protein [Gemmatimonadota bacterium]
MKLHETRRDSAATDKPDPSGALAAVGALMAERRRFEGWISALNARRASTPQHVFDRVHLDYTNRLNAVIDQLTSHSDELRRAMEALTARLAELSTEQQRAADERAESELRAHVGELSSADWQRISAASDASIADLVGRRAETETELARIQELLDSTARPQRAEAPPSVAASTSALPTSAPPAAAPRVSKAMATEVATAPPPAPAPAAAVPRVSTQVTVPEDAALPTELPPAVIAAEQQLLDIEERSAAASKSPAPPADVPKSAPAPRRTTGFDELAFLSSVVDTPAGTFDAAPTDQPDEKARRDTFARRSQEDSITNLGARATPLEVASIREGEPPPSSGGKVTSAIGRDTSGDGVKSLKCGECGALNYPTEWYCERCGAELASL